MSRFSNRDLRISISKKTKNANANATQVLHELEDYHMEVTINKSLDANISGQSVVVIKNLDVKIVEELENIYEDDSKKVPIYLVKITLGDETLVISELCNINTVIRIPERTTTMNLFEGYSTYNSKIKKTFNKGDDVVTIVKELGKEIGVETTVILNSNKDCLDKNRSILKSITTDGTFVEIIKKLLNDCIENKVVNTAVENNTIKTTTNDVTFEKHIFDGGRLLEPPTIDDKGVSLVSVIRPDVSLMDEISLNGDNVVYSFSDQNRSRNYNKSVYFNGNYKIREIIHNVDNFSSKAATSQIRAERGKGGQ